MRQSQLFARTKKELPKEAESISHQLLLKGDYIDQVAAGVYTMLPLGLRAQRNIENIIRQEMNAIDAEEVHMSVLQPKALWEETGRWSSYVPPLFTLKDRHGRELALGPTHEEQITDLVRRRVASFRDLPLGLYQIQTKFRNEVRATGGLLRTREFLMKDLYSFHASEEDFSRYYEVVTKAYYKIFGRCGLEVRMVEAATGSIGGTQSHEFMFFAETGEDTIIVCNDCDYAVNTELKKEATTCPNCQGKMRLQRAIEGSHIFRLGDKYSEVMGAFFTDKQGKRRPIIMGCYGIGVSRLLATIIEAHHGEGAILWPVSVAPFGVHIIALQAEQEEIIKKSQELEKIFESMGMETLLDDRVGISAGSKFSDADLIGAPVRIVVSEKTLKAAKIEVRLGFNKEALHLEQGALASLVKKYLHT